MTRYRISKKRKTQIHKRTKHSQSSVASDARIARILQLQNVVGNQAVQRLLADGLLQREEDDEFQLQTPKLGSSLGKQAQYGFGGESLQLDPNIRAQIEFIRKSRAILEPDFISNQILEIDPSILGEPQPDFLRPLPTDKKSDPFPQGKGPEKPKKADVGDFIKAVAAIPAVKQGLKQVSDKITDQATHDWNSLSTGGKGALITHSIIIGAGALAGIASDPSVLKLLENKPIPIPKTPVIMEFNLSGADKKIMVNVDVGQFLPKSWGFGKAK